MILIEKRIAKALIRMRGCADWSVPALFANLRSQVFSRQGPYYAFYIEIVMFAFIPKDLKSFSLNY